MLDKVPEGYRPLNIGEILQADDLVRVGHSYATVCPPYCICGKGVGSAVDELFRYWGKR